MRDADAARIRVPDRILPRRSVPAAAARIADLATRWNERRDGPRIASWIAAQAIHDGTPWLAIPVLWATTPRRIARVLGRPTVDALGPLTPTDAVARLRADAAADRPLWRAAGRIGRRPMTAVGFLWDDPVAAAATVDAALLAYLAGRDDAFDRAVAIGGDAMIPVPPADPVALAAAVAATAAGPATHGDHVVSIGFRRSCGGIAASLRGDAAGPGHATAILLAALAGWTPDRRGPGRSAGRDDLVHQMLVGPLVRSCLRPGWPCRGWSDRRLRGRLQDLADGDDVFAAIADAPWGAGILPMIPAAHWPFLLDLAVRRRHPHLERLLAAAAAAT